MIKVAFTEYPQLTMSILKTSSTVLKFLSIVFSTLLAELFRTFGVLEKNYA